MLQMCAELGKVAPCVGAWIETPASLASLYSSLSKIADMMILGNTKGMIRELQNLHKFTQQDQRVRILCQKLLDCEAAGIRKMHGFL